ncbi:hypothetical protein F66182_13063 [Fusarium sp. NRRL 66182]|nr:hypothetical protein F66182_13063 [Fusarium sp. NRRL 66182]
MSVGNNTDEVENSQHSDDGQDFESADSHFAGSEDAESKIVEVDDDGYQDLHRADIEDIRSEVGGDISGDLSGAEASFHDEALHFDPNLGLDDNSLDVHGGEDDTAQPGAERDIVEDLLGAGASFPDDPLHLDPAKLSE